jgi:Tol biopolymer transport system component
MNRLAIIALMFGFLFALGCKKSSPTQPSASRWTVQKIWPRGSRPVPAPVGDALLFMQEDSSAGLYLLQNGAAVPINTDGPAARADYAWSQDGSRFCFSAPGEPGSDNAGIYVGALNSPSSLQKWWDRGAHPRFLPGAEGIIVAGSEADPAAGIWLIASSSANPQSVSNAGFLPEVSPDGLKISYMVLGDASGQTLVVLNRETGARDTVAGKVIRYDWLSDSETLVFESVSQGAQQIMTVGITSRIPETVSVGTEPSGFPGGTQFVFTQIVGDQIGGLAVAAPGRSPSHIADIGTLAIPTAANRIIAQDSAGILELTN